MTVAALSQARDGLGAQDVAVMAQAIPVVTRADPSATKTALTEGYLSQPAIMAHASAGWLRAAATINLEGLTLNRGELSTGGYGEGYVDRRHPHSYLHEALLGATGTWKGFDGSAFAGRGFAAFGSDDPMVRPFEKYPVNHHLAQILERIIAVGAIRRGPLMAEVSMFNGDEPVRPGVPSSGRRFGDSWSSRVTVLPLDALELSGSVARVKSPEVTSGAGLNQRKSSVVGRFDRETSRARRYVMLEWARTTETDRGEAITTVSSALAEAVVCRSGVVGAARVERTDRPEEEQLLDPFRTPRPSVDLSNLGVSTWTLLTASVSAPVSRIGILTGRPFIEVARAAVATAAAGAAAGIFNPELRYGTRRMWMISVGVRLRAGSMHGRMGRYGIAATEMPSGTSPAGQESEEMPGMPHDIDARHSMPMSHQSMSGQCSL